MKNQDQKTCLQSKLPMVYISLVYQVSVLTTGFNVYSAVDQRSQEGFRGFEEPVIPLKFGESGFQRPCIIT